MDNNQQTPVGSRTKTVTYVVGAVILLLIISGLIGNRFGKNAVEKALEAQTGGDVTVNTDASGATTVETSQGTFSTGGVMPKNWPSDAPTYPKASITYSGAVNDPSGTSGISVSLTTTDSVQQVTDYFAQALTSAGWEIVSNTKIPSGGSVQAKKGARIFAVIAMRLGEKTNITLVSGSTK
ncbi:MAG: hypothetical protein Q7R85_00420 [bacterium]|nr:hypothetical protein [bacterium]